MDYGYDPRHSRMQPMMPSLPVATISTGVSLTDRFKHYQQSHVAESSRRQVAGYGLPPESRPNIYAGQRRQYNIPSLVPNPAVSARNRQLALALAKRAMAPPQQNKPFRGKLSVQSRLGIPTRPRGLAVGTPNRLGARRGITRAMSGRVAGLNQIQRSPGFINRLGNRGGAKFRGANQAQRISRGGQAGRGQQRGFSNGRSRGGGRGRGRGGGKGPANTEVKPSKEALDTELDSYMSHSKAYLDRQLDDYMLKAKEAQAAQQAGVTNLSEDVAMSEV